MQYIGFGLLGAAYVFQLLKYIIVDRPRDREKKEKKELKEHKQNEIIKSVLMKSIRGGANSILSSRLMGD